MTELRISEIRKNLSDTLGRVAYAKERVVIMRSGKAVGAIVPLEDLKALRDLEDRADAEAHAVSKRRGGKQRYSEVRKELGL